MASNERARPVGFCIYCGALDQTLSDEHVVPYSFGGSGVLPKASCKACAKITSQFEQFCARTMLGPFRVRIGAPTRRPKQRPKKLNLGLIDEDGAHRDVEIPSGDHPGILALPVFANPRLLTLPSDERRETFRMWFGSELSESDLHDILKRHGASAMRIGTFEILNFCRLLAKIGHGAAYYFDPSWTEVWEPLLMDLILGRTEKYDLFVGGNDKLYSAESMDFPLLFESVDISATRYLVAEFGLFASSGTPVYRVVVAKKRSVT